MAQPSYLTAEGLANLKAESEELRTHRRQAVAERIQKAKEIGGTVDNADYEEAKNEQAFIEGPHPHSEQPDQQCRYHLGTDGTLGRGAHRV